MLLDSGVCTIFAKVNIAEKGGMPREGYEKKSKSWYGELEHASLQEWPTSGREEIRVDMRIRILQNRRITNHDVVILRNVDEVEAGMEKYEVLRAYHGHDDESGEMITDLTLERIKP